MDTPQLSSLRKIRLLVGVVFALNAAFGVWVCLRHLNFVQVDLAGHIWSSVQFSRGLFHRFSDQIFLGYTHDLFYPPFEDFVLSLFQGLVGGDPFLAYRVYLSVLIVFFFVAALSLCIRFRTQSALLFASASIFCLVNLNKSDLLKLQGLSLIDLFVTGLSAETLSFCFFLLLIRESLSFPKRSRLWWSLLLAMAILSHIVIGFVAFLWVLGEAVLLIRIDRKQAAISLASAFLSLGLSAFYWLPLIAHKAYMPSSSIFHYAPWTAFALAVAAFGFSIYERKSVSVLAAGLASLLLSTAVAGKTFEWVAVLIPKFHYYRFSVVGYFLIAIALSILLDTQGRKRIFPAMLATAFLGHLLLTFGFQKYEFGWMSFQNTTVDYSKVGSLNLESYGRYLVLGEDRSADSGIDALLAAHYPEFRSTKGLYWESSRTNNLQSSFLATLMVPPVVLDTALYKDLDCEKQRCMLEQMFQYYNVKGLIGDPRRMTFLPEEKRRCFTEMFSRGLDHFNFQMTGELNVSGRSVPIFKLLSSAPLPEGYSTDAVVPVGRNEIQLKDIGQDPPYGWILDRTFEECPHPKKAALHLIAKAEDRAMLARILDEQDHLPVVNGPIELAKKSEQEFLLRLPQGPKRLYAVKLSPQPGAHAHSADGQELQLFESYPFLLVYAQGDITLRFERTWPIHLGHVLSMIACLVWLGLWISLWAQRSRVIGTACEGKATGEHPV